MKWAIAFLFAWCIRFRFGWIMDFRLVNCSRYHNSCDAPNHWISIPTSFRMNTVAFATFVLHFQQVASLFIAVLTHIQQVHATHDMTSIFLCALSLAPPNSNVITHDGIACVHVNVLVCFLFAWVSRFAESNSVWCSFQFIVIVMAVQSACPRSAPTSFQSNGTHSMSIVRCRQW